MRQRNGSCWGIAVLLSLLALLMLSGSAFAQGADEAPGAAAAGTVDEDSPEGGDAKVEAQGAGSDGSGSVDGEGTSDSTNGQDDVNCDDFQFQEDAQEFFRSQGGSDEDRLDEDDGEDDGIACEDLPSRDEGGENDFPEGGVETGLGGATAGPSGGSRVNLPLAAGGTALALLSLGLAAIALRRRA